MATRCGFKQIILNLLSNAVKFTETGSVTLQARIEDNTGMEADIYFAVTETGIGIPAEKLHLIFEKLSRRSTRRPPANTADQALG